MKLIVLDAGHGGKDPGAVANGLREKDLTLVISRKVGQLLEAAGANIKYTRNCDIFVELSDRAKFANSLRADYFLSIHINAGGGTGFESYTYGSDAATAAYRNVIHQKVAAVFIAAGLPDRGQKQANLAVLRETNMPAVLLELGFIDSARDAKLLKDASFLDKIAKAIADGICSAFGLTVTKPADSFEAAVKKLHAVGIIASPDYWLENAKPGKEVKGEHAKMLIENMAAHL